MFQWQKIWILVSFLLCVVCWNNQALAEPTNIGNNEEVKEDLAPTPAKTVDLNQLLVKNPVIDQAKVLSAEEKRQLSEKIQHIRQQGLAQIAIVIIPTTNHETIADYAKRIANKWHISNKKGLLMVVTVQNRDVYLLASDTINQDIPIKQQQNMIEKQKTAFFSEGNFFAGLNASLDIIEDRLKSAELNNFMPEDEAPKEAKSNGITKAEDISDKEMLVVMALIVFGGVLSIFLVKKLGELIGVSITACIVWIIGGLIINFETGMVASVFIWILAVISAWVIFFYQLMHGKHKIFFSRSKQKY